MSSHPNATRAPSPPAIPNPLKPQGLALLALAGGAVLIGLLGFVRPDNLIATVSILVFAAATGLGGLLLYLQPFAWPVGAPAGVCGERRKVGRLIQRLAQDESHLGTYTLPTGFVELLVRLIAPRFSYPTPAVRHLVRLVGFGIVKGLIGLVAAGVLIAQGFGAAGGVLILASVGLTAFRLFVLFGTVSEEPPGAPVVYKVEHRLTESGNPIALVKATVQTSGALRDGDDSRIAHQCQPDLRLDTLGQFDGWVEFETPPRLVRGNDDHARSAALIEWTAVVVTLIALAVCAFAPIVTEAGIALKVVGAVVAGATAWMLPTAFRLRTTFRFTSELYAVWFTGTYQHQKGGLHGAVSSEVALVRSDIYLTVLAARVVTECTPGAAPTTGRANERALGTVWSALGAPRYVVRTAPNENFNERAGWLVRAVCDYRDQYRDVVGLNLDSAESQRVQQQSLALAA